MADELIASPPLDDAELAYLERVGTRRPAAAGEYLVRDGDTSADLHVILSGSVEIVIGAGDGEHVIARHGARQFVGELSLLTGQRAYLSARVAEAAEVVRVPTPALREIIGTRPALGDKLLASFLARRSLLLRRAAASLRLVGSRFSPELAALAGVRGPQPDPPRMDGRGP